MDDDTEAYINSLQQFRRVKRYLVRLTNPDIYVGNAYYLDDIHSFFIHCYHLKDYIKGELPELNRSVEEFINSKDEFRICKAIAARLKHFSVNDENLMDAELTNYRTIINVGIPNVEGTGSIDCKIDIEYVAVGEHSEYSTVIDALDLARDLVDLWDEFFETNELRND